MNLTDERRRTIRTAFQALIALAAAAPLIADAAGIPATAPGVGVGLAVAAGVTRVMALPPVEEFLERFVPWLAAHDRPENPT